MVRNEGIELSPSAWKADIIAIRPIAHIFPFFLQLVPITGVASHTSKALYSYGAPYPIRTDDLLFTKQLL